MANENVDEKLYRPSATVIIAARGVNEDDDCNYKILLTKRSPETAITTDHHVFPGGVYDAQADDNNNWLQFYNEMGITEKHLQQLFLNYLPNRPKFLQQSDHCTITRDISLRITAIREVFEEIGILLCLSKQQIVDGSWFEAMKSKKNFFGNNLQLECNHDIDIIDWQHKVHNNGQEFFQMCQHYQIVPDLWSLHEWSAWRSPINAIKKYDTVFYLVGLMEEPTLTIEPSEVAGFIWAKPMEVLQSFRNGSIWLPGSLFYEISRLANFNNWHKLCNFALYRSARGCTLLKFAYYNCNDSVVAVLPGDDYFCIRNSCNKYVELPLTAMEFARKTNNLHRLHYRNWNNCKILATIIPLDGHLHPFEANCDNDNNFAKKEIKSKL